MEVASSEAKRHFVLRSVPRTTLLVTPICLYRTCRFMDINQTKLIYNLFSNRMYLRFTGSGPYQKDVLKNVAISVN